MIVRGDQRGPIEWDFCNSKFQQEWRFWFHFSYFYLNVNERWHQNLCSCVRRHITCNVLVCRKTPIQFRLIHYEIKVVQECVLFHEISICNKSNNSVKIQTELWNLTVRISSFLCSNCMKFFYKILIGCQSRRICQPKGE